MLKLRIITAICLLLFFLSALFFLPPILWGMLLLGMTIVASREWCTLGQFNTKQTLVYLIITTILGGELLFVLSEVVDVNPITNDIVWPYVVSLVFWVLIVPFLLTLSKPARNTAMMMLIGWLVLLPTLLAMYQLRTINPMILLIFMSVVWISDTAAYFVGKKFGKHKLAPQISPGKTWEGVMGALLAVLCYAMALGYYLEETISFVIMLTFAVIGLAILGIIGDLFESQLKRQVGIKDSGTILPGHGGVLDRIDALTSMLPTAALIYLIYSHVTL
ncbi:MAG TPA: phosphatidate cytidylyltransferase [Nitrosomonas sp.]|mgnify:FL=1|nr:phosphatidate cytidylyltransferase [Nitrosomonas sp.]